MAGNDDFLIPSVNHVLSGEYFAAALFFGMIVLLEIGRQWGKRRLRLDPQGANQGLGAVDGAVFALLGLLIAFSFSGAATRFDTRRALIVEEANAISTAWLRLDLIPAEQQEELRQEFRSYVDARLEVYRRISDVSAAKLALEQSKVQQQKIWSKAVAAANLEASSAAPKLLLPALTDMFDITTTRSAAFVTHPPAVVYGMLAVAALIGSLLAGYGMAGGKNRSWIHMIGFAAITAGAVFVILDLEYPRAGFIRVDSFDELLLDLRRSMD